MKEFRFSEIHRRFSDVMLAIMNHDVKRLCDLWDEYTLRNLEDLIMWGMRRFNFPIEEFRRELKKRGLPERF